MFSRPPSGTLGAPESDSELTPEEQEAWEAGLERVADEKRRALLDPGPSWKEWFFYDAAKWWVGMVFFIVDAILAASWFGGGNLTWVTGIGVVVTLLPVGYAETLLYLYLWRRPSDTELRAPGPFRPSWKALREVGRWTPEAARRARRGGSSRDGTPHPDEFL